MKTLSLLIASALSVQALSPQQEIDQKVPQARAILDAWKQNNPRTAKRTVHIVYWTPGDRDPQPQYRERLTRVMTHIQTFYAEEMKRLGFGPMTIGLDIRKDKLLNIHLVKAPKPYAQYSYESGEQIRKECIPILKNAGIDAHKEVILIFSNMINWDPKTRRLSKNGPYYARGTHANGTAWQVDSLLLDPLHLSKKQPTLHDHQYGHISIGKYNSIFIGGAAHELGHALGLPHNLERADERAAFGTALMGSGNRTYSRNLRGEGKGSFLTLAHGLRLAAHPMFNGSIKGIHTRGKAHLTNISITKGNKSITITGKIKNPAGSPPVHAVLAYTDPKGGSNYNATTATAIPNKNNHFTLHCTDLQPGKPANLRLIALHANGDATSHIGSFSPYTYPYTVDKDGQPDLDAIEITTIFAPVIKARTNNNSPQFTNSLKKIARSNNKKAAIIANRLLTRRHKHPEPAKIAENTTSVALSDTTPSTARVGWGRPTFNLLPNESMLLTSCSQIFTHGIYAHAPASHSYKLDGKWKKLTGLCGIADQQPRGSVTFIIKADGKEIWNSRRTKPGKLHRYNIDLTGKQTLELIVNDAGDGKGSDWGLWLEPTLNR